MIFTELRFALFFIAALSVHWLLRGATARKLFLLVCSYAFYAAWDWRFLSLILISTAVDYMVGAYLPAVERRGARRALLVASLVTNLGLLGFFKYFNFFVDSARDLLSTLGVTMDTGTLDIVLPVGISFYTFQTLSYTIDIYRGQLEPSRRVLDFALFVAFFPQLVAGPIVRARDFLPQLTRSPRWSAVPVRASLVLFLVGFFKKACLSDNVAPVVDAFFSSPGSYDATSTFLGIFLYAAQIYCDFSGYSDMAIACAALLGYRLCENFHHPYFAANITDFWRRWHISLSSWLRDYLYIPLGGNRHGTIGTYRNLMLTMVLGGLWHGAAWQFVLWGFLHGLALSAHKVFTGWRRQATTGGAPWTMIPAAAGGLLGMAATFYWVCLCWIFFRAASLGEALEIARVYFTFQSTGECSLDPRYFVILALMAGLHWMAYRSFLVKSIEALPDWAFAAGYGAVFALLLPAMHVGYTPFIYFQF